MLSRSSQHQAPSAIWASRIDRFHVLRLARFRTPPAAGNYPSHRVVEISWRASQILVAPTINAWTLLAQPGPTIVFSRGCQSHPAIVANSMGLKRHCRGLKIEHGNHTNSLPVMHHTIDAGLSSAGKHKVILQKVHHFRVLFALTSSPENKPKTYCSNSLSQEFITIRAFRSLHRSSKFIHTIVLLPLINLFLLNFIFLSIVPIILCCRFAGLAESSDVCPEFHDGVTQIIDTMTDIVE